MRMHRLITGLLLLALARTPLAQATDGEPYLAESAREALRRSLTLDAPSSILEQDGDEVTLDDGRGPAPRRWWPILLSAVVPGLGEAATGHMRGYFLIGTDAALIAGAVSKQNDGEDAEVEYKAFADEHYDEEVWEAHLRGDLVSGSIMDFFDVGTTPDSVPLWVSREEDEREWYENIGKWEPFFFGWREYWPISAGGEGYWPSDTNSVFSTELQRKYVDMRGESNDAFARRDDFVNISLLLRVFSVLQMTYLEGFIGGRYDAPADLTPGEIGMQIHPEMAWFAHSTRADSRLGLRMRF